MTRRLRIGFDVDPGQSGPGRYVEALLRGIDPEEFDVVIVSPADAAPAGEIDGTATNGNCSPLAPVEAPSNLPAITSSRMPPVFRSACRQIAPRTLTLWAGYLKTAKRQAKSLCQASLDLVHLQNTGCEESPFAARLAGVPRIVGTFHVDSTYDLGRQRSGLSHRALEHISNHCLHAAIAVSDATKRDWLKRTHLPARRVTTIHNGIDPSRFQRRLSQVAARCRLGLPTDGRLIIGGVGRLDLAKGFEYLIDAVAILADSNPTLMLAITGDGALREHLLKRAVERGISDRVAMLGFRADVGAVYDAIDVFALSSLSETIGYVVLEAMAHELPVVGTEVGGVPEVIAPGETGFLSRPRDGAALAAALKPLLESADLRRRMGTAGRERITHRFHERDCVNKTIALYRQVLSGHAFAANTDCER